MNDYLIWLLFLFVFVIIIGLYISEFTPLNLDEKEKILKLNFITENFSPSVSSTNDQLEGSSELYNWGLPDDTPPPPPIIKKKPECNHECNKTCPEICPRRCPNPILPNPIYNQNCFTHPNNNVEVCRKCDITQNKDIDKYVLKSSIPPCPDMSEYITKNMMNANPDLSDYILKSEIKPCEKIDVNNYILKSEIPACPTCPICPECPICPVCPEIPPQQKCKEIFEYNITEHPDIRNFIRLDDLEKNYIRKDQLLNNDTVKDYIKKYKCNDNNNSNNNNRNNGNGNNNNNKENKGNNNNENNNNGNNNNNNGNNNIIFPDFGDMKNSELLNNNITGYYAGDSLYAGI
jgi:hypothetical protein